MFISPKEGALQSYSFYNSNFEEKQKTKSVNTRLYSRLDEAIKIRHAHPYFLTDFKVTRNKP